MLSIIYSFLSIFLIFPKCSLEWILPPSFLVTKLALDKNRYSLIFHLPNNDKDQWLRAYRHLLQSQKFSWPIDFIYQDTIMNVTDIPRADEDLHFLLIDERNTNKSISYIQRFLASRNFSDKEMYAIDMNFWTENKTLSLNQAKSVFSNSSLDLDDDIFLYTYNSISMDVKNFSNNVGMAEISNLKVEVWEVYKIHSSFPVSILRYANFSSGESKGDEIAEGEKWQRRRNLQRMKFRVATNPSNPYVTKITEDGSGGLKMEGMFADVFLALQDVMNFSFVLRIPPDGEYGAKNENSTFWTGMVGMLQKNEIDIAATDFTVTLDRSSVITFGEPITQIYHTLFIQNPTDSLNYKAYIEPFHWLSWMFLAIFICITPPALFAASRYGTRDPKYHEFTLGKSYVFVSGVMTTARPWDVSPETAPARIAFLSFLFGGAIIYWQWEAMVTSYLSQRVMTLPFDDLIGLVENTDFRIAVTPGSSFLDTFKLSNDPVWLKAYKTRIEPYVEKYKGFGDRMILFPTNDKKIALYDNFYSASSFQAYENCTVVAVTAKYDTKPYAYGFQKDSPFLGIFNFYLKEMREKGALKQIRMKYDPREQKCPDFTGKALGLPSVFTAFLVLLAGIALGFVLFIIECCSKITNFNFYWLEAYDRGEKMLENVDPDNVLKVIQMKDDIIEDLENQVKSLTENLDQLDSKGRNGNRIRRRTKRMETFKTNDDPK